MILPPDGPALWTVFLSPHSRSCWLANSYFLQGEMLCPDEWWVCLGTCWKRSWYISKVILAGGLVLCVQACPGLLPSLLACPPLPSLTASPPPLQYSTGVAVARKEGGRCTCPSAGRRNCCSHRLQDPHWDARLSETRSFSGCRQAGPDVLTLMQVDSNVTWRALRFYLSHRNKK